MKIYAGSDHAGVGLRGKLIERMQRQGHEVVDLGPKTETPCDYPEPAARVGRAVRDDRGSLGLLVCGSGIGVSIAANKVRGVRAVAPWNTDSTRLSRSHNDANVLCLGARLLSATDAEAIVDTWLTTPFEGGRHEPRLAKIVAVEAAEAVGFTVKQERKRLEAREVIRRIWDKDPRAFTTDPAHEKSIKNRLGWLHAPEQMKARLGELKSLVDGIKKDGFTHAVLMGMGGSSLCPEVLAQTFGTKGPSAGLEVLVLDNTDPAAVADVDRRVDLARTLFVVASKSGGTIEVRSFEEYFWTRVLERHGGDKAKAGAQFVAITDPATKLEALARENRYRATFLNPPDVGGRYSALTMFGLVPAALLGLDVSMLLDRAARVAAQCREPLLTRNPAADLGSRLGALAKQGRDKLTLVLSPEIASLGAWIEQLVAESTGKLGKGILPVDGEPLGPPAVYAEDRVFVALQLAGGMPAASPAALEELQAAGYPVIEWELADRYDLGAEFFRWEFATALMGAALDINPFDEPNVTEAKEATGRILDARTTEAPEAIAPDDVTALRRHFESVGLGDYVAICAFFVRTDARQHHLEKARLICRDRLRAATSVGIGPRFLHSTGQLHKGGGNNGVFLQIVARATTDLPVPGEAFTFARLRDAQGLGDYQVLKKHGRRALRVDLGTDIDGGLDRLVLAIASALA